MPHFDLVSELLDRIATKVNIAEPVLRDIERTARAEWGGRRHYVLMNGGNRQELMSRDSRIRADFRRLTCAGTKPNEARKYLARRFGLSIRRIGQILALESDGDE
jgi:hypothetical protein